MKIYTKTGDDGSTGLVGGSRVSKSDARIECYGNIDELNSAIGLAAVQADVALLPQLRAVQNDLFVIGSHLATPPEKAQSANLPVLDEKMIRRLETEIDSTDSLLPPLRNFILPGGSQTAAELHLARTICRRAERFIVGFAREQPVQDLILIYLNRLSDWLFVQARLTNAKLVVPDVPWMKE